MCFFFYLQRKWVQFRVHHVDLSCSYQSPEHTYILALEKSPLHFFASFTATTGSPTSYKRKGDGELCCFKSATSSLSAINFYFSSLSTWSQINSPLSKDTLEYMIAALLTEMLKIPSWKTLAVMRSPETLSEALFLHRWTVIMPPSVYVSYNRKTFPSSLCTLHSDPIQD